MASLAIAFVYVQSVSTFALHVRASGLSNSVYGMLVSLNGLLIILLELPTTSITQRLRPRPVIACGMLVTGLGFGLTAWAHTVPVLVLSVAVWTFGEILGAPVGSAYVADIAPPALARQVSGRMGADVGRRVDPRPGPGHAPVCVESRRILESLRGIGRGRRGTGLDRARAGQGRDGIRGLTP